MRQRQTIYPGSFASATHSSEEMSTEVILPTQPTIRGTTIMTIAPTNNPTLAPDGVMPYPCPLLCAPSTDQVCGSDGFTYDSVCHMRLEACRTRDRSLVVNYRGPCQCPEACPMVYEPVCAMSTRPGFPNHRTFTSQCEMQKDACRHSDKSMTMSYRGECVADLQGQCNFPCDPLYEPVCSTKNVTYRSQCELSRHKCITQDTTTDVAYIGACPHAPIRCPNLCKPSRDPHCGSDGVTYPSLCEYGVAACKDPTLRLRYKGPCVPGTADPCSRICDSFEDPVCGTDGQTYWNPCLLQLAYCNNPSITLAYRGICMGSTRSNRARHGYVKPYYTAYGSKNPYTGFP
ncbi:agrin-like [Lytechinus variegatus]|uniref:agrin-like n=1 Tax=Lytechinus variegatus TaxID=7654 RepID=UPI001BB2137D|nr:agrin-like [Lytechinus variegatus]